ncbi:hypothetical protein WT08_02075 [Burkholderia sp. MSMB1552]|nr:MULTISPECIES: hypothetical protein [unclassified Burkholderia]KVN17940.1 hypothetical protein WT08_02075 [Burkholderia sp. MSMB1552]KWZ55510.1 hypothetical protein WS92_06005 [Burkholderia sp. MSMB1588]
MNWLGHSHRGDCRDLMRAMIADGVRAQTIVTSPPYWGLRGAGWRLVGARGGGNWNMPARPRVDTAAHLRGQKHLWEAR